MAQPGNSGRLTRSRPAARWPAVVFAVGMCLATLGCSTEAADDAGTGANGSGTTTPARAASYPKDGELKLNQIQAIGSHNSYHQRTPQTLRDEIDKIVGSNVTDAWNYEHTPLDHQFDAEGVRQIELDVHLDPDGRFAVRHALPFIGLPADAPAEMKEPGLKVFHVQEVDYASTCLTFRSCLATVKAWSAAHPGHMPIMILVEAKQDEIPDVKQMGFVHAVPFDAAGLDQIDADIRSVFEPSSIITPDQVRGSHKTLEEAVLAGGWPTLGASRGKVMFTLDNSDFSEMYAQGHPSLQGRVMFSNAEPGEPEAAFVKRNDAVKDRAEITELVRKGYVVRTLVDGDPKVARADDTAARDAAIASGAQWISTDYAVPDPLVSTTFVVKLPDGTPARCNPVNAPPGCTPADIENPAALG